MRNPPRKKQIEIDLSNVGSAVTSLFCIYKDKKTTEAQRKRIYDGFKHHWTFVTLFEQFED